MADIARVGREHVQWSIAKAGLHNSEVVIIATNASVGLTLLRRHEHADRNARTVRSSVDPAGTVGKPGSNGVPGIGRAHSEPDMVSPKRGTGSDDSGP
jgi:hypothetical protein